MKKGLVLLGFVLVFFSSTGFAIEWAGNAVIHLDAMDLDVGNVSAWTNKVGVGGNFNNVQGDPHVDEITEGLNGVPKKMVHFEAASLDSNVECMRWENNGPASITNGHSFSTEVWVHPESVQAWQIYFASTSRNDGTNPTKFAIGMNIGALRNAGYSLGIQYSQDPVLDKFHLMTVTFNSVTKDVKMYVNGVLQNTVNMPGWNVTSGRPVTIGAWLNGAETMYYYGLHGGIAELRVHDGTLTPEQIVANFNEQKDDFIYETYADVEQAKPAGMNGVGFGEVAPGNTAGPVTFIYKNIGNATLNLTNVAIVGSSAFTMDPPTPDLSDLPGGETRTIEIYFSPTDSTQQTADLTITSNSVTSPNSFPLSGNLDPIYVDAVGGSDTTGDGTAGDPYQTMMFALGKVKLSGEIIAAPGDYTAISSNAFQNKNVTLTAPEGATLEGTNWWLFNSGENYLTIDGFTFFSNNYIVRGAFAKEGACDLSWTVRNCTFNFPICEGALLNGGADFGTRPLDITVENCTFNLIGEATETRIGSVAGLGSQGNLSITDCVMNGGNTGVSVTAGNSNVTVDGFTLNETKATAINCGGTGTSVDIQKCRISTAVGAILLSNNGPKQVINCIVDGGNNGIILQNNTSTPPAVYQCTLVSSNDSPHLTGVDIQGGNAAVSNCIVLGWNNAIAGTNTGSGNITNGVTNDPKFVYQAGGAFARPAIRGGNDFHLTADSAAIDAGVPLTGVFDDFEGLLRDTSPDIGAYEFGGSEFPTPELPSSGVGDWSLFE